MILFQRNWLIAGHEFISKPLDTDTGYLTVILSAVGKTGANVFDLLVVASVDGEEVLRIDEKRGISQRDQAINIRRSKRLTGLFNKRLRCHMGVGQNPVSVTVTWTEQPLRAKPLGPLG